MIAELTLTNFRNYDNCQVEFSPGLNCIIGRNGQGKTNILEGIYYLSLLRSFRTSNINELRQWKSNMFTLFGRIPGENGLDTTLAVQYGTERKLSINHANVYRASDFINKFTCITFIPEDLSLVQGTPFQRRKFLDIAASQMSQSYMRHLQAYNEALHSRNIMLKDTKKYPRKMITAYDFMLCREGATIEVLRREFVAKLNVLLADMSKELLQDDRLLSVKYFSKIGHLLQEHNETQDEIEAAFSKELEKSYERDCERGTTHVGAHRSDFSCVLGDFRMDGYASQGECRIASLAIKLACLEILKSTLGVNEVTLLVDDVIGELDSVRRISFFNAVKGVGQTVFACTELPSGMQQADKEMHVVGGRCY